MWAFLMAFGGYWVALDINCRIHQSNSSVAADNNSRIHQTNLSIAADTNSPVHEANSSRISRFIVVFKSLSIVSLVSILVPHPQVIGYIILSISCVCVAVFIVVVYEVGKLYNGACTWIYKNIMESALMHIRNNNWFHEASDNNMIISSPSTEQPLPAISDIV